MISVELANKHQAKIKSLANQLNEAIADATAVNINTEIEIFEISVKAKYYRTSVKVKCFISPDHLEV